MSKRKQYILSGERMGVILLELAYYLDFISYKPGCM